MSAEPVSSGVRAVLGAPRGRRFSRPGTPTLPALSTREQRLLAQMPDNPRVAYRQARGQTPPWMNLHSARITGDDAPRPARRREPAPVPGRVPAPRVPRPRPAPDDGPARPRPHREPPPLPRCRPGRPRSHRKPRKPGRIAWRLTAYTLAALAGALAHHLAAPLL
ncbi:hypothetical protein [Nocardiopsis lambiniae]|uniref:Uncharacterized protein n=1 Tax=Nocardiopsis lambiniae TaxID=3075539 RepID=A0ABU2M967_9ACTN|nr:hypothetical protein [Nocardiopsis sp. DSM 44743]MDT0329204.1 hypothetical protein [Nocardiopsis sp. DSM 44743]